MGTYKRAWKSAVETVQSILNSSMDGRIVLLILSLSVVDSYKVLLFAPGICNSNLYVYHRLANVLGSHGHQVYLHVAQTTQELDTSKKLTNTTISYYRLREMPFATKQEEIDPVFVDSNALDGIPMLTGFIKNMKDHCEKQISDKGLIEKLKNEHFDIGIGHMYDPCPLGVFHVLNIPHIWMASGTLLDHMAWSIGAPSPASYVPNAMSSFGDKMSFIERLQNFFGVAIYHFMYHKHALVPFTKIFREQFGPEFPSMAELSSKAPLVFVNSEELSEFPRPTLHKIVYVGGMDRSAPKSLGDQWQSVMEKSDKGVVFLSFGSVLKGERMPDHWKAAFLEAFSRFPNYTFIWKFEGSYPAAAHVKNVVLTKWAPQNDLLAHPKMKVFITHCGFNSFTEGTINGVPILALPLFGDQPGNARRAERHGIAILLRKSEVTAEIVYQRLKTLLIDDKSYMANSKRLASMIKKKPVKAEQLVVGWVEFLAEHKELPNLQPQSAQMSLLEYFMLDIALFLLMSTIAFCSLLWFLTRLAIQYFSSRTRKCKDE